MGTMRTAAVQVTLAKLQRYEIVSAFIFVRETNGLSELDTEKCVFS